MCFAHHETRPHILCSIGILWYNGFITFYHLGDLLNTRKIAPVQPIELHNATCSPLDMTPDILLDINNNLCRVPSGRAEIRMYNGTFQVVPLLHRKRARTQPRLYQKAG